MMMRASPRRERGERRRKEGKSGSGHYPSRKEIDDDAAQMLIATLYTDVNAEAALKTFLLLVEPQISDQNAEFGRLRGEQEDAGLSGGGLEENKAPQVGHAASANPLMSSKTGGAQTGVKRSGVLRQRAQERTRKGSHEKYRDTYTVYTHIKYV